MLSFKAFKYFSLKLSFFSIVLYLDFYSYFDAYCFLMLLALVSLMHHVFVGHAIDFSITLNCIACPDDHLLDKCSL